MDGLLALSSSGQLTDAYDELGNRYSIPVYCLNGPTTTPDINEKGHPHSQAPGPAPQGSPKHPRDHEGTRAVVKVRLSTTGKDIRVALSSMDTVEDLKRLLEREHGLDPQRTTMLYFGRVVRNKTRIQTLKIPKGHVIQAVVT